MDALERIDKDFSKNKEKVRKLIVEYRKRHV
jgi:hypothetical protein